MGHPAQQVTTTSNDASQQQILTALGAFPSPASVTSSLSSPPLQLTLSRTRSYTEQQPSVYGVFEAANTMPAEPGSVNVAPLLTPPLSDVSTPGMNIIVGGALAPVDHSQECRPITRTGPALRLPSFEALGIAAPRPDQSGDHGGDGTLDVAATETICQDLWRAPYGDEALSAALEHTRITSNDRSVPFHSICAKGQRSVLQSPVHHFVNTLTPPAEIGELNWHSVAAVQTAALDSPSTDSGSVPTTSGDAPFNRTPVTTTLLSHQPISNVTVHDADEDERGAWIDDAIDVLVENLRTAPEPSTSLKILSHALPSPSPEGHIFSKVIGSVSPASPTSPLTWINVFHAIPGRFNLADLPRSPPSTPGPPVGGEDYFTEKVFDSAVSVTDYQEDLSQLPRSPRPIVPPSSIDLSIVERYIPPSTPNEFAKMFSLDGPSILVDRLIELSPSNGTLLFVYPTQAGAETFKREYLDPVLRPILLTMQVVHGLPSDLSTALGDMKAIAQLPSHERIRNNVVRLCANLTQRNSAAQRFNRRQPRYTLSYSAKQYVRPDRDTWARDWWTKQEKSRIRATVTKYAQEVQKRSSNERAPSSMELVQQVLDGVAARPYSGQGPAHGIEVSVFVIKRSE